MTGDEARGADHRCRRSWHAPEFYRYQVATPVSRRLGWNQYHAGRERVRIGAYVVLGAHAYCVRWASLLPDGDQP